MLDRIAVGDMPRKHHIAFRNSAGALHHEECLTRKAFDGPYTILYHLHAPHTQRFADLPHGWPIAQPIAPQRLAKRHYRTQNMPPLGGAPMDARRPLVFNQDVVAGVVTPDAEDPVYFNNGDAGDLSFLHHGTGTLRTLFGDLKY